MPRFQTARKNKYFVKKPVENRKKVMGVQSNNKKGTEVTGGPWVSAVWPVWKPRLRSNGRVISRLMRRPLE